MWCTCRMVVARRTRDAVRAAVADGPSATAASASAAAAAAAVGSLVRGAVRDPTSLRRRRPSGADIHHGAAVVGAVGGDAKGGKSPCLAILASLHHAYAPLIIVTAVVVVLVVAVVVGDERRGTADGPSPT